jgi:hypothetical protein
MKKHLKEIEDILRNGKLPDADTARLRHQVWQKLLRTQRERRKFKSLLKLQPWIWALASIILILLCVLIMMLLK